MANDYISQITLPNNSTYDFRDKNLKLYTGSCATAAGTAIKDVTTDGTFTLEKGAVIFVNFTNTNSAAVGNLKLKLNGEADANAKPIKYLVNGNDPANIPGAGYLRANQTYMFRYDGTNWVADLNYYLGTVTSVRVQASSPLVSSSSAASSSTLSTTISFANQNANTVLAGPSSGNAAAPAFRALTAADIPDLSWNKITSDKPAYTTRWPTWDEVTSKPTSFTPSSHTHYELATIGDKRGEDTTPNTYANRLIFQGLKTNTQIGSPQSSGYSYLVGLRGWSDSSGGNSHELAFNGDGIYRRQGATTTWGNWFHILDSNNTSSGTNNAATLTWSTTYTIAKINGTDIKFTTMAKPSYNYSDIGSRPTSIKLTGAVTGSVTLGNGENSIATTVNHNHDDRYKIASGVITLGSSTITPVTSVNGHTGASVSVTASDLGLASALKYVGAKSSLPTATDSTTYSTYNNGDVITVSNKEYAYVKGSNAAGSSWVELGDEGSYKLKQTAFTNSTGTADGSNTSTTFIYSFSQDENGAITNIKTRKLPTYNNYSHPTGDGNLHVPATGTGNNGKFLKAGSAAGSLSWATLTVADISDISTTYYKLDGSNTGTKLCISTQSAAYTNQIQFMNSTTKKGSIGTDNTGILGLYSASKIVLRPELDASTKGVEITSSAMYPTASIDLGTSTAANRWGTIYAKYIKLLHTQNNSNEVQITYGSTIDFALMVGTGNENHGLYDTKKSDWVLYAGADNKWILNINSINHLNANKVVDGTWPTGTRGVKPTATTTDGNTTYSGGTVGKSILTLGNNKVGGNNASAVDDNAQGQLNIYSSGSTMASLTAYAGDKTRIYPEEGISLPYNKIGMMFRADSGSYYTYFAYENTGNEALVAATQNSVTSFIFVNGESYANVAAARWTKLTGSGASGEGNAPGLQIKQNCVSIGELIPSGTNATYKLNVNGTSNFKGNMTSTGSFYTSGRHISLISGGETDQFIDFAYAADPTASTAPGASWRIGALNSGSGDSNYFVIQTGGSATNATTWNNALRLGMNTYDAGFGGNVYPLTNNNKTLGTSSLKWNNVYATTFTGDLTGNATSANYLNLYETRGTTTTLNKTANYVAAGAMFHLIASSSTSADENGKPPSDANILQMNWDNNGGYDSQLGISTSGQRMYFRTEASKKTAWQEVAHAPVGTSNIGSATRPVYVTSAGVITLANNMISHLGNAGKSNMNDVGRLQPSAGMTQLSDPGNNYDNPKNGTTKSTGWHLYWDTSYSDDPNGSNAWVAQIVNKAGTSQWWVRSRSGSTITNGTAWASSWRHLVTSTEAQVGSTTQPVYIDENGEVQACTTYANASVSYADSAGSVAWANTGHPDTFTPSEHTHGNISNTGTISTSAAIVNNDALVIAAATSGTVKKTSIVFDGNTTSQALTKKGTWGTFLTAHGSSYGKIASGAVSTTVTNISTNTATIESKSANEKLTIQAGNKWIQTGATNSSNAGSDVITLGHLVPDNAISNLSTTAQTPSFNSTFNIPTISLDEAGHVTGVGNTTVKIPALPSSVTPSSHKHGNINNDGTLGTTASYGVATDGSKKIIAIDLSVSDPTASGNATTFVTSVTQSSQGKISVSRSTVPNASSTTAGIVKLGAEGGAATYSHTHSYLSSHGPSYGGIQVSAQSTTTTTLAGGTSAVTVTAAGANETVKFITKNKWIVVKGSNSSTAGSDEVQFAHVAGLTAKTSYCSTSATASANGGKITVTDIQYDEAGHITSTTDRTITLSQTTYTLSSLGAASSTHVHGNISNTGTISTSAAPVNGDAIVISTSANNGLVKKTTITFDASTTTQYLNKKGEWSTPTDTKNTAGSTATASKIFLVGTTSQAANPQTYSTTYVYATDGTLSAKKLSINDGAATPTEKVQLQWNSTDSALEFVFS